MKRCPYCAEEIQDEAVKCKHCGSMLRPSGPDTLDGQHTIQGQALPAQQYDTLDAAVTQGRGATVLAGQYRVVRKLGEGGMGVVYLAEDMEMGNRPVAIKVLPPLLARNVRAVENLRKEAMVAIGLTHPNIIRLYGFHSDGDLKFLVMEYIDGQTLEEKIVHSEQGKLTVEEVLPIAEQIATALDYAHSRKPPVFHRDLKPSNVMIDKEGTVKLLDFGIAREMKDSYTRVTGQETSGTIPYMSPEQLNGDTATAAMDIYSLGATLYECLASHTPFHTGDIRHQILNKTPPTIPDMPEHVNQALQSALAKRTADRPTMAASLFAHLKVPQVTGWEALEAQTPQSGSGLRAAAALEQRARWRTPLFSAAVVALTAIGAYLAFTDVLTRKQTPPVTGNPDTSAPSLAVRDTVREPWDLAVRHGSVGGEANELSILIPAIHEAGKSIDSGRHSASALAQLTEAELNAVAVTVNGNPIKERELREQVARIMERYASQLASPSRQPAAQVQDQVRKQVLDRLIAERLLDEQVAAAQITISDEDVDAEIAKAAAQQNPPISVADVKARVEGQGGDFEETRNEFRKAMGYLKVLEVQWADKIKVTQDEAEVYYHSHRQEYEIPEQVRVSHILVSTHPKDPNADPNMMRIVAREKTERLLRQVREGGDFAVIAKENSDCPSAAKGGDLDFFPRGRMVKPFDDVAFALRPGEVSDIVETQFGYHIVWVTDHKDASVTPFAEAVAGIFERLSTEKKEAITKQYIQSLREKATIVYSPGSES